MEETTEPIAAPDLTLLALADDVPTGGWIRRRLRCVGAKGGGTARQEVARVPVGHDPIRAEDGPSSHRAKDNSGAGP
jgi:hypothetical protein